MRKVFLSSTSKDLLEYREAVAKAIHGLDGYHCVQMENFGSRAQKALDFCRGKVRECDIFVGILGLLYGSCPEGVNLSYTEDEYVTAIEAGIPRLMFVSPENFNVPGTLREQDEMWARQQAFRSRVNKDQIRATFSDPDELARVVVSAIHNWEKTQVSPDAGSVPTFPSDWRSRAPQERAPNLEPRQLTVSVRPLLPVEIIYFRAQPSSIPEARRVQLCYGVVNARSARIDQDVGEIRLSEKACVDVSARQTTTYTLTATGYDGKTVTQSFTLRVGAK